MQKSGDLEQTYFRWRKGVWGAADRAGEAAERVGAGKCEAEAAGRESEPGFIGLRAGKLLSPERRRCAVEHACTKHGVRERRACDLAPRPRGTQRYRPTPREDEVLSLGRLSN